ncbi:26S proteasome non-ATPase regulatory subunit 14, partial [Tetrabaena socialis]
MKVCTDEPKEVALRHSPRRQKQAYSAGTLRFVQLAPRPRRLKQMITALALVSLVLVGTRAMAGAARGPAAAAAAGSEGAALNNRAVAVVVDPVQSVKGKVVIDAFRLISPQTMMLGQEPRQTTSNLGHLNKPSIQALIHGLNRHYYSIAINYRKNELEERMLLNLSKQGWTSGLRLADFAAHSDGNEKVIKELKGLAE